MPDIYTARPDKVMRVLEDAGFESRVEPTIIKDRPAEITYRFRGEGYYAEFYIHDIREAAGALRVGSPDIVSMLIGMLLGAALALVAVEMKLRRRGAETKPG